MWKEKYTVILLSALIIAILVFLFGYHIPHEYGHTHGDMSYDDYEASYFFVPM
jgi:uncharacterized membrane protein